MYIFQRKGKEVQSFFPGFITFVLMTVLIAIIEFKNKFNSYVRIKNTLFLGHIYDQ